MNTPIKDFTDKYAASGTLRCHMPGHKGKNGSMNALDITEINGADSLFEAEGIIAESERNAASVFGSYKTLYSAGGSTLCIQTMLAMCVMNSGSKKIIAARNCHRSFIHTCALLGAEPEWILPEYDNTFISGNITPFMVDKALENAGEAACVYLTSPDYLGRITPLDVIAEVCKRHNTMLVVDNAHGAYLRFIMGSDGVPLHPVYHGADICCDSAHKTLPVLTGGAYLHINNPDAEKYDGQAKEIMSMFGSSSPSYLILRSLDMCNKFLFEQGEEYFGEMAAASAEVKENLKNFWQTEDTEPGKLSVFAPAAGYTGTQLAAVLRTSGIECEYADNSHVILMLTGLSPEEIRSISNIFDTVRQPRILVPVCDFKFFSLPPKAMGIREAALSESELIDSDSAVGRICARAVSCCPPGIAVVVSGEIFTEEAVNILKNYSIFKINVVK